MEKNRSILKRTSLSFEQREALNVLNTAWKAAMDGDSLKVPDCLWNFEIRQTPDGLCVFCPPVSVTAPTPSQRNKTSGK